MWLYVRLQENMRIAFILALGVIAVSGCGQRGHEESSDHYIRVVSLPEFPLQEGERIAAVSVTMRCGRFRAVNHIPTDWSLTIEGPVSEVSELYAIANHGTGWLYDIHDLDDFVTVLVCEPSCFDITAAVITSTADDEKTRTFTKQELLLSKAPTIRLKATGAHAL